MKVFFKTFFIFLCFLFLQGVYTPNQTQEILSPANYIQNSYNKIFLTAGSTTRSEIYAEENNGNQSFSFGRNHVLISSNNLIFHSNNNAGNTPEFIHNLSTDPNTEISIRAP